MTPDRIVRGTLWIALGSAALAPGVFAQDTLPPASTVRTQQETAILPGSEPCNGPEPVCALLRTFLTAFNARDFDAFRQTFADDISFFVDRPYPPRRLDGRAAAEAVFAGGFAPYGAAASDPKPPLPTPLIPSHLRVQAFGDVAIITFEVVRPAELARRTLVARREAGEWRIVHIHASSADTRP